MDWVCAFLQVESCDICMGILNCTLILFHYHLADHSVPHVRSTDGYPRVPFIEPLR